MPTIKLHSNGNVITKDGKVSCSCCDPCNLPDEVDASSFDIEEDCNTGTTAPVAAKRLLRVSATTMEADVDDVNYISCSASKIQIVCEPDNERFMLRVPLVFRPNDTFTECPEGCAALAGVGYRSFAETIYGNYVIGGFSEPDQTITISKP